MDKTWLLAIAIALFMAITFLYWKLTHKAAEKEFGKKMFKQGSSKLYYWQGAIYICTAGTVFTLFLLKCTNVLNF